jgi:hypothetical protein
MALVSVGSLVVTAIGLYAVYVQIRKLREAVWGDTHGKLCDESLELLKFLAEKPQTYDYFYKGKELEPDHPDRVFVLYASEALVNFLEHLVLQKRNLPEPQWATWRRFICSTYESSPTVRSFLKERRDWYSEDLTAITDECEARLAAAAAVVEAGGQTSDDQAREALQSNAGGTPGGSDT